MKANEWLELTDKFVFSPDSVTEDELWTLRSNYIIWSGALQMIDDELKNEFNANIRAVTAGRRWSQEVWSTHIESGETLPGLTDDQMRDLQLVRLVTNEKRSKVATARTRMKFYKRFDQQMEKQNDTIAPEVQEIFWKKKAENLLAAIEEHRRAHVLANKQPNGLDFALWQEADLGEFHSSVHAGLQKNGFIAFQEG